jgi:hypothetical protein
MSSLCKRSDIANKAKNIPSKSDIITALMGIATNADITNSTANLLTKDAFVSELSTALVRHTSGLLKEDKYNRDNDYIVAKMTIIIRRLHDVFSRVDPLSKDQFWTDIKDEISLDVADQLAFVATSDRLDRIFQDLSVGILFIG